MKTKSLSLLVAFTMAFSILGVFPVQAFAAYDSEIAGFTYEDYTIPAYDGDSYEIVNGNDPEFLASEMVTSSYEYYTELDSLGRCGIAQACLATDIMPGEDEERGSISSIYPTGWIQAQYSIVPNSWLYNRCHLIGWQLSAENANKKNLITGTRSFNVDGMLVFENMVADYINDTDNHVLYRVTPVFQGDNMLATGVLIEAESVEDDTIEFCVFCYNVQPGVSIDYADGSSCLTSELVAQKSITDCEVTLGTTTFTYSGYAKKPAVTVTDNGTKLEKGVDYSVAYSNNTKAGTAKVTVTGAGNYKDSVTKSFTINKKSMSGLTYSIPNKAYTGKQIKPAVTIKNGSKTLVKGTDYTVVSYGTNKKIGKGYVTVKGKGNYKDTKKITFYIVPKTPTVSLKSTAKKSISFKWTNVSGESGYQVAYKKSTASTYKTSTTTKCSKTISSLTPGTKYNIKVRSYKTIDGVKRYGSWSTVRTYKTTGTAPTTTNSKTVYITETGSKYHLDKNCRGLSNANKIITTTLTKAKADGYTLCGYED